MGFLLLLFMLFVLVLDFRLVFDNLFLVCKEILLKFMLLFVELEF